MTKSSGQVDVSGSAALIIEDDATPFVRVVARAMRLALAAADVESVAEAGRAGSTVAVSSRDDAQALTCTFAPGTVELCHGVTADVDATLVVDIGADLTRDGEKSIGDSQLLNLVDALLHPPIPDWREAAQAFWRRTQGDPGMPHELVLHCTDEDEYLVLGAGSPTYTMSARGSDLARVLSGTAPLLESVFSGTLAIRGSLPQLSVMAGASNKVRFDV